MNVAFLEANHDSTTAMVHKARRSALKDVGANHKVVELFGSDATAEQLSNAWIHKVSGNFGLVSAMGHGDSDEFLGQHNATVFAKSVTNTGIKDAVVHLYSCCTAQQLGEFLVQKGARAFIGYNDFVIVPNQDKFCDLYVREAAAIDKAMCANKTSAEVRTAGDQAYQNARSSLTNDPDSTPEDVAGIEANHGALVGPWSAAKFGSF